MKSNSLAKSFLGPIAAISLLTASVGVFADANSATRERSDLSVRAVVAQSIAKKQIGISGFKWDAAESRQANRTLSAKSQDARSTSAFRWASVESPDDNSVNYVAKTQGFRWGIRSTSEQQGFRWGIRSASEQQGFRWGIRSASEQQGFRWGIRSASEQQGFRWGIRSASEQQGFRWGIRSASEQQGFRWGIRSAAEQQGFRWGIRRAG